MEMLGMQAEYSLRDLRQPAGPYLYARAALPLFHHSLLDDLMLCLRYNSGASVPELRVPMTWLSL